LIPAGPQGIGKNREKSIPPGSSGIAGNRKESETIGKNQETELIQSDSQEWGGIGKIGKNRFRWGAPELLETGKNREKSERIRKSTDPI
jgi:hypothetical protein